LDFVRVTVRRTSRTRKHSDKYIFCNKQALFQSNTYSPCCESTNSYYTSRWVSFYSLVLWFIYYRFKLIVFFYNITTTGVNDQNVFRLPLLQFFSGCWCCCWVTVANSGSCLCVGSRQAGVTTFFPSCFWLLRQDFKCPKCLSTPSSFLFLFLFLLWIANSCFYCVPVISVTASY
jgi:hypothetical protein